MLNPKKHNEYIKVTAEELGVDEDLVQDIVDFYWKEIRKALSELKAPRIEIANFGSFRIKSWKLEEAKNEYKKRLNKHNFEKMTFQRHAIKAEIEQNIQLISNIQKMVEEDLSRKQEIKNRRNVEEVNRNN